MRNKIKWFFCSLLLFLLSVNVEAIEAQETNHHAINNLHLSVGLSSSILQVIPEETKLLDFAGLGFNTYVSYEFSYLSLGVKSIALIGIRNSQVDRGLQIVSFTPFIKVKLFQIESKSNEIYASFGTASAQASLDYQKVSVDIGDKVATKTTIAGRGVDIAIGLEIERQTQFEFAYQNISPGEQQLVNIEDFSEVLSIRKTKDDDFERVQLVSFSINWRLF